MGGGSSKVKQMQDQINKLASAVNEASKALQTAQKALIAAQEQNAQLMAQYQRLAKDALNKPPPAPVITAKDIDRARAQLAMDCKTCYNFAVIGQSGAGKSSLLNAIRGVMDIDVDQLKENESKPGYEFKETDASPVEENETTMHTRRYKFRGINHIALWDLPGAGTKNHPIATYFQDKCLYAFDCLILVTSVRFYENEVTIIKQADEAKVPVVLLRSKADTDFENRLKRQLKVEDVEDLKNVSEMDYEMVLHKLIKDHKDVIRGIKATDSTGDKKVADGPPLPDSAKNMPMYVVSAANYSKEARGKTRTLLEPLFETRMAINHILTIARNRRHHEDVPTPQSVAAKKKQQKK